MENLLCRDCTYFRQSMLDPKSAFCTHPGARTSDVDLVFGYKTHYQCKAMRASDKDCGTDAKWFKAKHED